MFNVSFNNPEGGSKTSQIHKKIPYQWDGSAVGADIEYRPEDYMPNYFAPASFVMYMG